MKVDRIHILIITGVLFVSSIFINNKMLFAIAITMWIASIVYNMVKIMHHSNTITVDIIDGLDKRSDDACREKKYVTMVASMAAFPMMFIGAIIVILSLGCIWSIAIK